MIASPPCTLFSILQQITGDPRIRVPALWKEAVEMVQFAFKCCEEQRKNGRLFLFEHPLTASSWKLLDM